jgi:hypothetical protein
MNLEYFYTGANMKQTNKNRTKHEVVLQDHVFHLHKDFIEDEVLREYALKNPRMFDIEHLNEEAFNHASGYKRNHKKGETDTVDAYKGKRTAEYKTGSVRENPKAKCKNSFDTEIRNVASPAGVIKQAPLIVTMYNQPCNRIDYFFIPQEDIHKLLSSNGKKGNLKIKGTFNTKTGYAAKLRPYHVSREGVIKLMK